MLYEFAVPSMRVFSVLQRGDCGANTKRSTHNYLVAVLYKLLSESS